MSSSAPDYPLSFFQDDTTNFFLVFLFLAKHEYAFNLRLVLAKPRLHLVLDGSYYIDTLYDYLVLQS
jgi:hypothetical protein